MHCYVPLYMPSPLGKLAVFDISLVNLENQYLVMTALLVYFESVTAAGVVGE